MEEAIITYSAKLSGTDSFKDTQDFYAGTYTVAREPLRIDVRIWNNKYGTDEVESLKDFAINLYFGCNEDAFLTNYLNVKYDKTIDANIEIIDGIAVCTFWEEKVLSGAPNNGKESDKANYMDLIIELDAGNSGLTLKNRDLKSLYIELIKQ